MGKSDDKRKRVFAHVRVFDRAASAHGSRWPQVLEICGDYSSRLREVVAGGEVLLDLTGTERFVGMPLAVGREIRNRLRGLGLEAAVGLGPTTAVARLASEAAGPGEVRAVPPEETPRFLERVPVEALPGVDEEWARWLRQMGIDSAGSLAALPEEAVARTLGERGLKLWQVTRGEETADGAPPLAPCDDTSGAVAGAVDLFPATGERGEVRSALREAAESAARQLRRQGKVARQVGLQLIFRDMRRIDLRRTLITPTRDPRLLTAAAVMLFDRVRLDRLQVRRVRIRAGRLVLDATGGQLALPMAETEQRRTRASAAIRG